jgi:hypothetical protein
MQPWQIKALELELSALDALNGFLSEYALYFLVAIICLMVVLLAWVLGGGLGRRFPQQAGGVGPVIVIQSPAPPPLEPDDWNPFPPPHYYWRDCDCDPDEWEA